MEIITATELKRRKWVELIMECNEVRKTRDISVTEFCAEKGVSEKSYWYYHKKIGDQLATTISKNMAFGVDSQDEEMQIFARAEKNVIVLNSDEVHVL